MGCGLEEQEYQIYRPIIPRGGYTRDFFLPESDGDLSDQLAIIVDGEGPVLKSVVMERLAKAWGLGRFNQKFEARLSSLFPDSLARMVLKRISFGMRHLLAPRRITFGVHALYLSSRRKVQEVCLEELGNVALYVLEGAEELNVVELTRRVCQIIGTSSSDFRRERINRALRIDFIRDELHIDGDTIMLSKLY